MNGVNVAEDPMMGGEPFTFKNLVLTAQIGLYTKDALAVDDYFCAFITKTY